MKASQVKVATDAVKANKTKLVTVESWFDTLRDHASSDDFVKEGSLFCDGLCIPACKLLFNVNPHK